MKFAYATGARPLEGYTIKRGIGIGGFGDVYFALSEAGKEVALKRIQRNMDVEVRGVTQCLNLKHTNLVDLFDIRYDDEGQAWVVMEYVRGESLKDVLDRNPHGLPLSDFWNWFAGIGRGVAYLHDQGIVHRDLKPGNIFLDGDTVKIGDYGLSKYISCSRRSGQTESVGTFHYMAPEIGKGVYGKEIDVYALGIILFEMLTGHVPFEGESSQEIIMKHLTADPDLSVLPAAFRPVIQRALFKDPNQRFATVVEMLSDVEVACGLRAPRAAPPAAATKPIEAPQAKVEMLYIGDEQEGIEFGPLQETVTAEAIGESPFRSTGHHTRVEPIAQAVREGWQGVLSWWRRANLSLPVRWLLVIAVIFLIVLNSQWLIPAGVMLGVIYLVYYGLRSLVLAFETPVAASAGSAATPVAPPLRTSARTAAVYARPSQLTRRVKRKPVNWKKEARARLQRKHSGERVTELTGSLLMAAFVSVVVCFLMILVSGGSGLNNVFTWTNYAWLSLTSTAGSWVVLGVSKSWESDEGEHFRRRFVMMIAGLAVGLAAFGSAQFLDVRLAGQAASQLLPAFLVYFAGLFAILRWWLQADPLRGSRVSLGATGVCVFWSWLLYTLCSAMSWPCPEPVAGMMLAASISLAVQLSASWISPRERNQIREQAAELA